MDLASGLRSEVVRPTVTLLIPGATVLLPYWMLLRRSVPGIEAYLDKHPTAALFIAFIAMLGIGLVLENFGALVESMLFDPWLKAKFPDHLAEWYDYLRLSWDHEPVGQRYLRTVLLHLKFELSMLFAVPISFVGFCILLPISRLLISCGVVSLGLSAFFWREARAGARVLHRIRKALLVPAGSALPEAFVAELAGDSEGGRARPAPPWIALFCWLLIPLALLALLLL